MQNSRKTSIQIQVFGGYLLMAITLLKGLIFVPMYLSLIGSRLYGLWLASGGILVWLSMLDLGISQGLIQRIASHYGKKDYNKTGQYFVHGLLCYIALGCIFVLIGFLVSIPLPSLFKSESSEVDTLRRCFQLAVISNVLSIVNNVLRGFASSLLRPLFSVISALVFSLVGLCIIVYMLFEGHGLYSIPTGSLVTNTGLVAFNGGFAIFLVKQLKSRIFLDKVILSDLISIIPSLFGARLGESLVKNIEPTIIAIMISPELSTAFAITRRAGDIVSQGLHIILGSSIPSLTHLYGEGNLDRTTDSIKTLISFVMFCSLGCFSCYIVGNEAFMTLWIKKEHYLGNLMSFLIGMGLLTNTVLNFLSAIHVCIGNINFSMRIVLVESIVRISLMVLLVYFISILGIPLSIFFSCTLFSVVLGKKLDQKTKSHQIFPVKFSFVLSLFISAGIIVCFITIYPTVSSWATFIFMMLLVFFSLNLSYLLNFDYRMMLQKSFTKTVSRIE